MNLNVCRDCRYYMIDDGQEVICRFNYSISYLKIRQETSGGFVCRCPRESEFEKKSGLNNQTYTA